MYQSQMNWNHGKKQAGLTLIELVSSLVIFGLVISGALALFGSASSSQKGNQMLSDVTALRSAVKGLYAGQGGYSTANLNSVLKTAKKIPSTMTADASSPPVITHSMNGSVTVTGTGGGTTFSIALTNIPTDVCVHLLSNSSSGWASIQVGTATPITLFPVSPATAASATNCAASDYNTITFVGS